MGRPALILLDTHIWVWWTHGDEHLRPEQIDLLDRRSDEGVALSVISCWEVAKLVERGRLELSCDLAHWFRLALSYPGLHLANLTPEIIVDSTRLPGSFHRDPADQLIVATARVLNCELATFDQKILGYPHVRAMNLGT